MYSTSAGKNLLSLKRKRNTVFLIVTQSKAKKGRLSDHRFLGPGFQLSQQSELEKGKEPRRFPA